MTTLRATLLMIKLFQRFDMGIDPSIHCGVLEKKIVVFSHGAIVEMRMCAIDVGGGGEQGDVFRRERTHDVQGTVQILDGPSDVGDGLLEPTTLAK